MPFTTGTAPTFDSFENGHRRLFRIFRRYLTGCPSVGTVGYVGTGNGVIGLIDTGVDGPTETWTITFTSATAFTVTGSVSGVQAAGTTGTNYTSNAPAGRLSFRINQGGTPFIAGDTFTIPVTVNNAVTGNNRWVVNRWDPFATDLEFIGHGLGLAGADKVYVGFRLTDDNGNQLWHLEMKGYTGYSPSDTWDAQPGASPTVYTPFWNQSMPYWIAVNGRRAILVARSNTTYHAFYTGLFLPYATPQEYPYPLMICGEHPISTLVPYTSLDLNHFNDPGQGEPTGIVQGNIRRTDGTWLPLHQNSGTQIAVWPYDQSTEGRDWMLNMEPIGTAYTLFPLNLIDPIAGTSALDYDPIGYLDGAHAICGFGQAAENTVTVGGDTYRVFQNVYRTGRADYWCLKEA